MREGDTVQNFVKDTRTYLNEVKNVQFIGSNSALYYSTGNEDLYDYHTYSDQAEQSFRITFDYATAEGFALLSLAIYWSINHQDVLAFSVEPTGVSPDISITKDDVAPPERGQFTTIFYVTNNTYIVGTPTNYDVYIKFFFTGTDTGSYIVERLT